MKKLDAIVIFTFFVASSIFAQTPQIVSISPAQNQLNVPVDTVISITFDIDMDSSTINDSTVLVNGRCTGFHDGIITYDSLSRTAVIDPAVNFAVGEVVTVVLTSSIESSGGTAMVSYVWSFTAASEVASGGFGSPTYYAVGPWPYSIFSADLDADGDFDLATANYFSNDVSVLLNMGDGNFAPHMVYPVGLSPTSIFSADLDSDGDLDLATANTNSNSVSVLLNIGDGSFAPQTTWEVGLSPNAIFSADLDGDGDLDLATANNQSDNVSILLNNGNGSFAPQQTYAAGDTPFRMFSADLDGDGDHDLVVANYHADSLSVLLNNSDGTFAPHIIYPVGDEPASIYSADLDGDSDLDLVTISRSANYVSVLKNNGNGSFAPQTTYATGAGPHSIFSADLDGDGDLDLATTNCGSSNVSVLLNNGDGSFPPHSTYPNGAATYPISIFAADLDGDGDLDLATANNMRDNVSVLLAVDIGWIAGVVSEADSRDPIPDVHVVVEGTGLHAYTDSSGKYILDKVPVGAYSITFSHDSYNDSTVTGVAVTHRDTTDLDIELTPSYYNYLPGDANMYYAIWPPAVIGSDVTYLVNYFRGFATSHACYMNNPNAPVLWPNGQPGQYFWASADANGDCMLIGSDVTRLVGYLRGGSAPLPHCLAYEPAWHDASELPDEAPDGWPGCE
jgi:hypothetical protein